MITIDEATLVREREEGLGGSDAGAVLGFNQWSSPLDVYLEKVEGRRREETEAMRWGKRLEDLLAQDWSRKTGHALAQAPTLWHPEHDWMLAHVDRLGTTGEQPFVWEGKVTDSRNAGHWGPHGQTFHSAADAADHMPAIHVAQVAHYMAVADRPLAVVAVLLGLEPRWYWLHRDRGFEEHLVRELGAFWHEHVLARVPPAPRRREDLDKLHPQDDGSRVRADAGCYEALQAWHAAQQQYRAGEAGKESARFRIARFMGNATELVDADGRRLATWRREGNRRNRTFRAAPQQEDPNVQ